MKLEVGVGGLRNPVPGSRRLFGNDLTILEDLVVGPSLESLFSWAFAEIGVGSTKIRLLQEAGYEAIDELNRE